MQVSTSYQLTHIIMQTEAAGMEFNCLYDVVILMMPVGSSTVGLAVTEAMVLTLEGRNTIDLATALASNLVPVERLIDYARTEPEEPNQPNSESMSKI